MAIMRKLLGRRKETFSSQSAFSTPDRYTRLLEEESEGHVRRGYVPVIVGEEKERFFIRTEYISHPVIVSLLELSADEFGFRQEGVLQIPTNPTCFREIVRNLQ